MTYNFTQNQNLQYVQEDNWSVTSNSTDIWTGKLPFGRGSKFPTDEIRNRAKVSKTNKLIFDNDANEIFSSIISIFPELNIYGYQIREIIMNLPYFKNCTNAWVGLVAGEPAMVDINSDDDVKISELLEKSNFASILQEEVRSRFMDVISAYRVDVDINGRPTFVPIKARNLIVYVSKDMPTSVQVVVVFSIYTDTDNREKVDFVEYHYDGLIRKTTYLYGNDTIGDMIGEPQEERAFGGKFKTSPIILFKHNVTAGEIYGTDQYRYWCPSILAGMRELQNVMRLAERCRDTITKVPDNSIKKDAVTGASYFFNKGTIGYKPDAEGKSPDIEFVVPEIRMQEAIQALEAAVRQIGIDTQLGIAFFNVDKLGARLSGDSIRAALYPARLEAQRIGTEMLPSIKEMVIKLGYMADIDISSARVSVEMFDGFPHDELNDIKSVQMRLESNTPSITLENAIMKLDHVPLRIAKQRAEEIRAERGNYNVSKDGVVNNVESTVSENDAQEKIIEEETSVVGEASELRPNAGVSEQNVGDDYYDNYDDNVWETQMPFGVRDIPQGYHKAYARNKKRNQ